MSDFESLVRIAQNQGRSIVEGRVEEDYISHSIDPAILEREKKREQNPRYLAEKEKIRIREMDKINSPFQHPCQNEKNTITLVSIDKCHEIDIEFNHEENEKNAMVNLIRVEPTKRDTLLQLLQTVNSYLREEKIEKVYQYVVISDWDISMSKVPEFKHVRTVVSNDSPMPFVIVECDVKDLIVGIIRALAMDIDSHLDPEDLDSAS